MVDLDATDRANQTHILSGNSIQNFNPRPIDLSNMNLDKEMLVTAEKVAENSHNVWAKKVKKIF